MEMIKYCVLSWIIIIISSVQMGHVDCTTTENVTLATNTFKFAFKEVTFKPGATGTISFSKQVDVFPLATLAEKDGKVTCKITAAALDLFTCVVTKTEQQTWTIVVSYSGIVDRTFNTWEINLNIAPMTKKIILSVKKCPILSIKSLTTSVSAPSSYGTISTLQCTHGYMVINSDTFEAPQTYNSINAICGNHAKWEYTSTMCWNGNVFDFANSSLANKAEITVRSGVQTFFVCRSNNPLYKATLIFGNLVMGGEKSIMWYHKKVGYKDDNITITCDGARNAINRLKLNVLYGVHLSNGVVKTGTKGEKISFYSNPAVNRKDIKIYQAGNPNKTVNFTLSVVGHIHTISMKIQKNWLGKSTKYVVRIYDKMAKKYKIICADIGTSYKDRLVFYCAVGAGTFTLLFVIIVIIIFTRRNRKDEVKGPKYYFPSHRKINKCKPDFRPLLPPPKPDEEYLEFDEDEEDDYGSIATGPYLLPKKPPPTPTRDYLYEKPCIQENFYSMAKEY